MFWHAHAVRVSSIRAFTLLRHRTVGQVNQHLYLLLSFCFPRKKKKKANPEYPPPDWSMKKTKKLPIQNHTQDLLVKKLVFIIVHLVSWIRDDDIQLLCIKSVKMKYGHFGTIPAQVREKIMNTHNHKPAAGYPRAQALCKTTHTCICLRFIV